MPMSERAPPGQRRTERAIKLRSEAGNDEALRLLALEGADLSADSVFANTPAPHPTAGAGVAVAGRAGRQPAGGHL